MTFRFDELVTQPEYKFFKDEPRIKNLAYLTVSGSNAYGTNVEGSDLDLRGFIVENKADLMLGSQLDVFENRETDTVIYGFRKLISLLRDCNPSVVELFGTKPEHVLVSSVAGRMVRENIDLFLTKKAFHSFAGYATAQLRRLQNALAREDSYPAEEKQRHLRESIEMMMFTLKEHYQLDGGEFSFETVGEGNETEVVVTVRADKMPLRKFSAVNSSLHTMVSNYDKLNHRNRKKDLPHLRKHAMHLVRLYLEGIDVLRGNGIQTFREKDVAMLRKIRFGEISMDDVFQMAKNFEGEINEAFKDSSLPKEPDPEKVRKFMLEVYRESGVY